MTIALISFAVVFLGALLGACLRRVIPEGHLNADSRDVVKLLAALIATQAALVVGLLVSSAKNSFDSMNDSVAQGGASFIVLDQVLSRYGPEAAPIREQLRVSIEKLLDQMWPEMRDSSRGVSAQAALDAYEASTNALKISDMLRGLNPQDDSQRLLKTQALQLAAELIRLRWGLIEKRHSPMPTVLLTILILWFAVLFATFGLLTPGNATVFVIMLLGALSIAGGVLLILDLSQPMDGMIKVSGQPLVVALQHVGR
jgi:hypothetical protein